MLSIVSIAGRWLADEFVSESELPNPFGLPYTGAICLLTPLGEVSSTQLGESGCILLIGEDRSSGTTVRRGISNRPVLTVRLNNLCMRLGAWPGR